MSKTFKWIAIALGVLILFGVTEYWKPKSSPKQEDSPPYVPLITTAEPQSIQKLCVDPKRERLKVEKAGSSDLAARLKAVPYEICDEWIRFHFKGAGLSDQLITLRESIDSHKDNASKSLDGVYKRLQIYQWGIVFLGLLATILTGWASRGQVDSANATPAQRDFPRNISFFAMVVTALITSMTALGEFYGLRGSVARTWTLQTSMAALHSEIDDELSTIVSSGVMPDIKLKMDNWWRKRSKLLQDSSEEWKGLVRGGK